MIPVPRTMVGWQDENCFFADGARGQHDRSRIHEGDMVVVRSQPSADPGEIVVALLGEEATVKRLAIQDQRVCLMPRTRATADL